MSNLDQAPNVNGLRKNSAKLVAEICADLRTGGCVQTGVNRKTWSVSCLPKRGGYTHSNVKRDGWTRGGADELNGCSDWIFGGPRRTPAMATLLSSDYSFQHCSFTLCISHYPTLMIRHVSSHNSHLRCREMPPCRSSLLYVTVCAL